MKKPSLIQRVKDVFGSGESKEEDNYERTMHKLGLDVLKDQKLEHRQKLLMQFEESMSEEIQTNDLIVYVQELKDRQNLINHAIVQISAPYGRAGDIPRFGKMFHGWGRLNASASSWILRTSDIVKKTAKPQKKEETQKPETSKPKEKDKSEKEKTEAKPEEKKPEDPKVLDDLFEEAGELLDQIESESIDPRFLVQCLHDVLQKHIWKDGFLILKMCFLDRDISERSATVIQNVNAQRERENMSREPDFQ